VNVDGWLIGHEIWWEQPLFASSYFAEERMSIMFDRRGVGSSQREVGDITLENQVADLAALVDQLNLPRFGIYGGAEGGVVASAYTAEHPERVERLLLSEFHPAVGQLPNADSYRSFVAMVKQDWQMGARMFGLIAFPDGPVEMQKWMTRSILAVVPHDTAVKYFDYHLNTDCSSYLANIQADTLVQAYRESTMVPVANVREVATMIPRARFKVMDGAFPVQDEATATAFMQCMRQFFTEGEAPGRADHGRAPVATILFTDIESSTTLTQKLGDEKAQELVRAHNLLVREGLAQFGGSEIKHTGDGIMASFASASGAVNCAVAIQSAVAKRDDPMLQIRIGVNAGEPVVEEDDLYGTSVQLARRICDHGDAGQIIVSSVVRDLAAGKGIVFADRGEQPLKGFAEPVRIYEVQWRP
jgi:class 3 adenylate cyclase